ncbi:hypothetical protein [Williamsia deligens]|uniref:Uncharacterized protein n=1 Tax=Williamsia deligens TaxID=321325 RepID=A0ABW3G8S7_9NOCA|nr:hypothetical protein [Williamsia deligens]
MQIRDSAVEVRQKRWFVNSYCMFPLAFGIGAVLMTAEHLQSSSRALSIRYVFVVACAYIAALLTLSLWWRFRGSLRITGSELRVGHSYTTSYDGLGIDMTPARAGGFPYLTLTARKNAKARNLYPTMSYGLEANSVCSTLRHLAETDEETRRSYSPELIREMLLFRPDREVAVGESIDVRIVAQPEDRTA